MPTYDIKCPKCGATDEVFVKIDLIDHKVWFCVDCGCEMKRLFSPVGIVFKGSGFYSTDKRGAKNANHAKAEGEAKSPSAKV